MNEMTTLAVATHVFGSQAKRSAPTVYIALAEREITARELIGEHVRAEVARAQARREGSLALHYLLDEQIQRQPAERALDAEAEVASAIAGFAAKRYVLMVDGVSVTGLDQPLPLTERSSVSFVRLMPLIGG
ncbi:MAG TPA: hypothetical protein VGE07_12930 [Herpetosiphonaceae bacterium]